MRCGEMTPFFFFQKSEASHIDSLPSPPFESELKRASAVKTTSISKQTPISEVGTSVVPRQRPKGNVSTQNLPLVLPSSPSPRNTISSPSPQMLQADANTDNSFASDGSISTKQSKTNIIAATSISQVDATTPTKSNTNEDFEVRFEAKFPDTFPSPSIPNVTTPGAKLDLKSPQSPPIVQNMLSTPKAAISGHRRIMSDTTAFNK